MFPFVRTEFESESSVPQPKRARNTIVLRQARVVLRQARVVLRQARVVLRQARVVLRQARVLLKQARGIQEVKEGTQDEIPDGLYLPRRARCKKKVSDLTLCGCVNNYALSESSQSQSHISQKYQNRDSCTDGRKRA